MHTPLRIQCHSGWSLGMRIIMRKLVECPVVASTPRRSAVRYTGQSYIGYEVNASSRVGCSQITGAASNRTCGAAEGAGGRRSVYGVGRFAHAKPCSASTLPPPCPYLGLALTQALRDRVPAAALQEEAVDVDALWGWRTVGGRVHAHHHKVIADLWEGVGGCCQSVALPYAVGGDKGEGSHELHEAHRPSLTGDARARPCACVCHMSYLHLFSSSSSDPWWC